MTKAIKAKRPAATYTVLQFLDAHLATLGGTHGITPMTREQRNIATAALTALKADGFPLTDNALMELSASQPGIEMYGDWLVDQGLIKNVQNWYVFTSVCVMAYNIQSGGLVIDDYNPVA